MSTDTAMATYGQRQPLPRYKKNVSGDWHVPERQYKVLVLGLDGATFDLILPWVEQGHLPCLGRLLGEGSWSRLRSTIPPITPCAWSSFMTGKNPGKHGLFDFVEPVAGSRGFRFTNAGSRHGETLWGYLSRLERRVGVLNVPMTYPPEPVNGYLVSGLDTPHEHSNYMFPATIRQELSEQQIPYRIELQHLGNMRSDARRDKALADMKEVETLRTRALKYLSAKYPADFRMLVYGATDQVAHHFWHYMDEHHDKHDPAGAPRYSGAILDIYKHVDQQMASILADEDDDTVVIVMSDHGFGPTSNVRLRLNQIMQHHGLLSFMQERSAGRLTRTAAGILDRVLRMTLSADVKRMIAGMFPRLRVWFEGLDEAKIDWSKTVASTNEAYRSSPAIWINHWKRHAEALVRNEQELEKLVGEAEQALKALNDPKTGKPAISNIYRTKNLYHGPYADQAPDLLPSWWEDGFLLEQSIPGGPDELLVERCTKPIAGGVEFAGSHRLDGVFVMARGPAKKNFSFSGADITDVAPTVLYLMGLPIPEDMDGRVLSEALDGNFLGAHEVTYREADERSAATQSTGDASFSEEEEELVAKRLQALGYIE
jgi:predicted AlkP superfamily phosphohydrolase/phosphomutase